MQHEGDIQKAGLLITNFHFKFHFIVKKEVENCKFYNVDVATISSVKKTRKQCH